MSKSGYAAGSIVELTGDELKAWRRKLPKGSTRIVDTGVRNLRPVDHSEGDTGTVRRDYTPRRYVEPLEVIDKNVSTMLLDLLATKARSESAFLDRVRNLKALAGWDHLTDEQAAAQLEGLARKIAAGIAEEQYKRLGKTRPVEMDQTGITKPGTPILLPGQAGRT